MIEMEATIRKRVFVSLIGLSLLIILTVILSLGLLIANRVTMLQNIVLLVVGIASATFIAIVGLGLSALVFSLLWERPIPRLQKLMQVATEWLFPIALKLGQFMGVDQDQIKSSFIQVNNKLVQANKVKVKSEQILILAPHCLQKSSCPHKITVDVDNCARCGNCCVDGLLDISKRYGVKLVVATGGTFARKFIKEFRPRAIVAIACERDLTSGIQDTNMLPVIGVLNIRPEGPCWNTLVNMDKVENAIESLLTTNDKIG